jgi:hypothetical protein
MSPVVEVCVQKYRREHFALALRVGLIEPETRGSRCCRQSFYLRGLVTRSLAELRKTLFESSALG